MVLSIAAQAAVHYPTSGGEKQLRNAVRDLAEPGDTIVLADGVYAEPSDIAIEKEGLVIMAAEGAKPIVAIKGWATIQAKASFIINGITFDGMNDAYYFIAIKGSGLYDITLKNCEFTGWKQWAISNQYDAEFTVGKVLVDSCLFHDAPNSAIRFSGDAPEGMHACQHLEVTNSTFNNIGNTTDAYGTVCAISNANAAGVENKVVVDHCTFYNCLAKSTDHAGIYVYGAKGDNVQISNNILALAEAGEKPRAIYSTEYITASNCLTYNYTKDGTGIRSTVTPVNCIHQDPLFLNPSAGDFNLQPGSPAIGAATDGTNLGDPRWKVAAAELAFAMAAPAADVEATDLYTIKWTVLDPDGDATIKLEYKAEEGDWTTIAENIPSTQSAYDWNIRKMPAQTVAIRGTLANATKSIVSEAAGKLTIVPEAVAPRPVRELTGLVEESALTLTWINPDQPFSTTTAIETLEQAVADGTAELTYSEDNKEVTAAYTTEAAWVQAGLKLPMNLEYVNSLTCQLKRDVADGTQIMITIEQNGYDWWYLIETGITTEWTDFSFTEFKKLDWHNESDATVLDGTNVTAIYISTNDGSPRTGSVSLRNLVVTGNAPAVADYEKTIVCVSEEAYPTTIVAEEVVYEGTASTWTEEIDPTKDLYVSVFAQDDLGNTSVAAQYKYTAPEVEEPEYDVIEDEITNLAIDLESMCIIGGPSSQYAVDVFLVLTEQNLDGTWALSAEESSVAISSLDATFIDGYAYDIDVDAPAVKVVLHVEFSGTKYELQIDMTSKPVNIEITDATIIKEEYPDGEGGTYTNWTMEGQWSDGNTTYPVLVDMSAFDPTVAEADIMVNIMVGSWLDVFFGAAEGLVHATVAENVVTLTGTLVSYTSGTWNINISAQLPKVPSALENLDTTIAPAKVIKNGQLVIIKNGVQYNAQGAVVK